MKYILLIFLLLSGLTAFSQLQFTLDSVQNKIKVGKMAGNRSLAFGIKNILEEYLQEQDIELSSNAGQLLKVEVIFLDQVVTQSSLSVMHKNEARVVVRLRGYIINKSTNQILKTAVAEKYATEISMSTLVIDTGGKLNQQNLSIAIKKCCEQLVTSLLKL